MCCFNPSPSQMLCAEEEMQIKMRLRFFDPEPPSEIEKDFGNLMEALIYVAENHKDRRCSIVIFKEGKVVLSVDSAQMKMLPA